jgi:hypothetical protein
LIDQRMLTRMLYVLLELSCCDVGFQDDRTHSPANAARGVSMDAGSNSNSSSLRARTLSNDEGAPVSDVGGDDMSKSAQW